MEDDEFRSMIATVIGAVTKVPEVTKLAGSGKVFSFGAADAPVNWYLEFAGEPVFGEGVPDQFDVRALMTKADWLEMLKGNLSATQAMLRRRLKVEGSMAAISALSMDALVRCYKQYAEDTQA